MLSVATDTVCFIVVKAREFGAKVEPDDPASGSNPSDDRSIDVLEDMPGDPTLDEMKGTLEGLNEDQTRDLVALMFVGRGDFERAQWSDARRQAEAIPPADRARYLLGTAMLGDYLEEGLAAFALDCADVERDRL